MTATERQRRRRAGLAIPRGTGTEAKLRARIAELEALVRQMQTSGEIVTEAEYRLLEYCLHPERTHSFMVEAENRLFAYYLHPERFQTYSPGTLAARARDSDLTRQYEQAFTLLRRIRPALVNG